jgi:hypothetical protein
MVIAACRGTVQNNRLQIISGGFLHPANNFYQFFFSCQHAILTRAKKITCILPTAGRAASAAGAAAKSAKPSAAVSATAKSSAAPTAAATAAPASASAQEKWQQPQTAIHASSAASTGAAGRRETGKLREHEEKKKQAEDQD